MIPEIFSHRSIRSYLPEPVPEEVLRRILEAGVRASTTGNMQLYSLVVTTLPEIKERRPAISISRWSHRPRL